MKLIPDRARLSGWAAAMLILGLSAWLVKMIRYQAALTTLYIAKDSCSYREEKSAVIFLDDRARKTMTKLHMRAQDIAEEANRIYAEQGLPFRYGIKDLKIRKWSSDNPDCKFLNARFAGEASCFIKEMLPRYRAERRDGNPDLLVFLTANGLDDMSGKSYWKIPQGNGTIVLNLGADPNRYDSDAKLSRVARKFFIRRFAQMLIHEHAHLYGAVHSSETYSIMKANLDMLGDRRVMFDLKTLDDLKNREAELVADRNKCAAQK